MKALEPTKIIHREGGGPYAYKTKLDCCVVGPINCISKGNTTSCNRVADRDVASSELASHHFVMEKSVKDVSLEEMFQAMYQHDFREPELVGTSTMLKCGEVLLKDKKLMENLEMGTSKKDDHYVVPLPFRDPNFMFPNNRKKPVQRLMGLKRRFMKDNKFFQDYPRLMDNMLRSSCAKRSDLSPSGKTWYVPLHGEYHPSKPDKIRIVFYCSAEFQGKYMVSGPDLTYQIIGVFIRFREEKNCLHGRCSIHVLSGPGSRGSAVIFKIPVVGESRYRYGFSYICNVCTYFCYNIVSQQLKLCLAQDNHGK